MSDSDLLPEYTGAEESRLLQILLGTGARRVLSEPTRDLGIAESLPYPFLAIVKQNEMRIALMLTVINPAIGGVLLIGPRGTAKTTAVRSLTGILPDNVVSTCPENRLPENCGPRDADGVCQECGGQFGPEGPVLRSEPVRLIELPLNARLEDVVGGINERIAVQQQRVRLERGILARADQNLLYIDEVNLLDDIIVDAILDAAAQGSYTVRRGAMVGTYRSRFVLIGSMNPEEGRLRPQIMDRFGLRVIVRGLTSPEDRLEVYNRVRHYRQDPRAFIEQWAWDTAAAREDIIMARELLKAVVLNEAAQKAGLALIERLEIDSHRAEYTMFETARAYAAADGRKEVTVQDIRAVAPLALRQRQSHFMRNFFNQQADEDKVILEHLEAITGERLESEAGASNGSDES